MVDASPAALEDGRVACVPGLPDAAPVDGLAAAELAIRTAARGGRG
ncbi:hypothetical protein [Streptomyces sp. NPDC014623]